MEAKGVRIPEIKIQIENSINKKNNKISHGKI